MKKTIILLAVLSISVFTFAQSDTTKPKEKLVYIFDNVDTVKVSTLLYKGPDGNIKWSSPGYEIRTGRATIAEDKKKYWYGDYKVSSALDDKKRPVKPID